MVQLQATVEVECSTASYFYTVIDPESRETNFSAVSRNRFSCQQIITTNFLNVHVSLRVPSVLIVNSNICDW